MHVTQPESVASTELSHIFLKKELVAQVPYIAVHKKIKKEKKRKGNLYTARSSLYNTGERGERILVTLNVVNMVVVSTADLVEFSQHQKHLSG